MLRQLAITTGWYLQIIMGNGNYIFFTLADLKNKCEG